MKKKIASWMYLLPIGIVLWIFFSQEALELLGGSLGILGFILTSWGLLSLLKYFKKMF